MAISNGTPAAQRRAFAWRKAVCSAGVLLACRGVPGTRAQDSSTCTEVNVAGLSDADGFPADSTVYTNNADGEDDVRGEYIAEGNTHFIWYSPTDPTEYTADTPEADIGDCNGLWVISSYPVGATFTDTVWYETAGGVQCEKTPAELDSSEWVRVGESGSEAAAVAVSCTVEEDDDGDGITNKTVIIILIVIGVGFMILMCLGALACCVHKGKSSPEQAIMPPGELGEGSVIGGKAGEATKPGLHAHPEVQGSQHPRPEDWAPSYHSNRSAIPSGSRSGPSVRSIGYQ